MELDIILVFSIIFITIVLFVTEYFTVDKIAFFLIASLTLLQLVSPEEAISGFSNSATITVLCLMIVAIGLEENGVIKWLSEGLKKLSILPLILIAPIFMVVTAGISAFISTTAVVIIFIKIVFQLSERFKIPSGKLLMPISFAGILGGSCTLMGTSTNLIVNSLAQEYGAERLGFFEFAIYGLCFLVIGIVYMVFTSKFLPKTKPEEIDSEYGLDSLVATVEIAPDSKLIGKRIEDTIFYGDKDLSVLKLIREDNVINEPGRYISLREEDKLIVMCDFENLVKLSEQEEFIIHDSKVKTTENTNDDNQDKAELKKPKTTYAELLLLPGSILLGKTLTDLRNYSLRGATPIAIKKRKNLRNTKERLIRKDFNDINLKPGDRILIETSDKSLSEIDTIENVAVIDRHDFVNSASKQKRITAFIIFLLVVGLAASGVLTILASAITGVALMLGTKCLDLNNTYKKIDWQIIFLLAGMIPLGVAMSNSGADMWISENLIAIMVGKGDVFVLGLIFLVTMLLSGTISNNATAIIMLPIAISVANGLGLSLKPFILAIMFAANFSFFTPVGYQTNTLIYGLGIYKFKHFLIVGGILSVILWVCATLLLSTLL